MDAEAYELSDARNAQMALFSCRAKGWRKRGPPAAQRSERAGVRSDRTPQPARERRCTGHSARPATRS